MSRSSRRSKGRTKKSVERDIYGRQESGGLAHGGNRAPVVGYVILSEGASCPVIKPFMGGLIAADAEIPGFRGDVVKIFGVIEAHAPWLAVGAGRHITVGDAHLFDDMIAADWERDSMLHEFGGFEQMQSDKFCPECGETMEGFGVGRQGQARKVYFQERSVAFSVGGRMEDRVGEVKNGFGRVWSSSRADCENVTAPCSDGSGRRAEAISLPSRYSLNSVWLVSRKLYRFSRKRWFCSFVWPLSVDSEAPRASASI